VSLYNSQIPRPKRSPGSIHCLASFGCSILPPLRIPRPIDFTHKANQPLSNANPLYAKPSIFATPFLQKKIQFKNHKAMPIDLIHPHISHHDNYFIINNPAILRTNLLQFLHSCISGSSSKPVFPPSQPLPLKTLTPSDLVLVTTGSQAPDITLTPSSTILRCLEEECKQDKKFLRVPRVELRRVATRERACERNLGCRCVRCGKRRNGRIAAIKRRRARRERDGDEGERSEIEG
jgi:hypothetical protein